MLIRFEQDRLAELIPMIEQFASGGPDLIRRFAVVTLGWMYAQTGRSDDTARLFAGRTTEDLLGYVNALNWLQMRCLLLESFAAVGDLDETAALYDSLLPFADHFAWDGWVTVVYGSVERFLGVGAAALGRWDAADGHFRRAVVANTAFGAPVWVAQSHVDHAAMLRAAGRTEEAAPHLDAASDIAGELGLLRIARRVRELRAPGEAR